MNLRDLPVDLDIALVRDGAFASLGFVSHAGPDMLVFLESEKYLQPLLDSAHVRCVITKPELLERLPAQLGVALASSPRVAFYRFHNWLAGGDFYWRSFPTEIAASALVHPRAHVAERDVRIGKRCRIEPNATILERSILDDDVVVRANAVIGSEGFQFVRADGRLLSVAHGGGVHLHRGVEVQSNTCVDKAVFGGFTEVGEDTKIDNLVHIAHSVKLGKRNQVVAGAMVAGSVVTGDDVWIGPMASVSHEIRVGEGATVTMGAVVTKDVPAGGRVTGNFAIDHARFIAFMKSIR